MTGLSEQQFPELESRVCALAPQMVRLFYNHNHHGDPLDPNGQTEDQKDRWASFVRAAKLAQRAKASINVTWQSIVIDGVKPPNDGPRRAEKVRQFANLLDTLVDDPKEPITNLKWVTVQNEPNTAKKVQTPQVTRESVGDTYRELHELLKRKGLRKHIGLMGGDLIEPNQRAWLEHMSQNYADILNAYSVHIYWQYDHPEKIARRLEDVRAILDQPDFVKKPVYVTEYGVKGYDIWNKTKNPTGGPKPGRFLTGSSKIDMNRTKVAAFQQAWFLIAAAQRHYAGVLKWDCYYGRYDNSEPQQFAAGLMGRPGRNGWVLHPSYHLLRMVTLTTAPGWRVIQVDPLIHGTQYVAAFEGDGNTTVLGLDAQRAEKNTPSSKTSTYKFSNLPKGRRMSLLLWNRAGGGQLVVDSTVETGADGHATIETPVHSVFALTTKDIPPL